MAIRNRQQEGEMKSLAEQLAAYYFEHEPTANDTGISDTDMKNAKRDRDQQYGSLAGGVAGGVLGAAGGPAGAAMGYSLGSAGGGLAGRQYQDAPGVLLDAAFPTVLGLGTLGASSVASHYLKKTKAGKKIGSAAKKLDPRNW
jgi:phage tail tape-measure protein